MIKRTIAYDVTDFLKPMSKDELKEEIVCACLRDDRELAKVFLRQFFDLGEEDGTAR